MSSKGKSSAQAGSRAVLVPKLRFPEFHEAGAWETAPGYELFRQVSNREAPPGLPILAITQEYGAIPRHMIDYNVSVTDKSLETYKEVRPGDFIISLRSFQGGIEFSDYHGICSPAYVILRKRGRLSESFYRQHFKSFDFIRQLTRNLEGLRDGKMISYRQFSELQLLKPTLPEQQKIANCLDSADALIAAQGRKVEALKAHKQGLMQQLFPQEGETQPHLRFPEFEGTGEWEESTLSELCDIRHGYAFESEFFRNEGDYVLLTPGNFYEEGGYRDRGEKQKYFTGEIPRDYVLTEGDLLIAMTEQAAGLLGSPILVPQSDKFLHNQRLGLVTRKPGVAWLNEFFFYVLNTLPVRKAIHDTASGAKVRHTSPTKVGDIVVSVPTTTDEQQRVADCLTCLEDLIAAEVMKLDTLKTHKKGLMQQLFPQIGEDDA